MRLLALGLLTISMMSGAAFAQSGTTAVAELKDGMGKVVGNVTLRETPNGVLMKVDVTGIPAGVHAFHIHAVGTCEGPQFTTAGPHFAGGGAMHGLVAQKMPHAGDMPNVYVGADGKGTAETLAHVTLAAGPRSLFDTDGSALVLHATADDYVTDPAGNAGGRIACGVVRKQ